MEENWLWYLAGSIDTGALITVYIRKDSEYAVGYELRPQIAFSRNETKETVFGLIDEYAEEHGVQYRINEMEGKSKRLLINDAQSVERFLEPLRGGFIQQQDQVEIMLEEVVPAVKEGEDKEKQGFYELVGESEKLRELNITRKSSKYTQEYFEEEWSDELE